MSETGATHDEATDWQTAFKARQPRITLADTQTEPYVPPSELRLIDPYDAAVIFADGGLRTPSHPARPWDEFTPERLMANEATSRNDGRVDLSMDLIGDAIIAGRVRCAFPEQTVPLAYPNSWLSHSKLDVLDPKRLAALSPEVSWEDGCRIVVDTEGEHWEATEFFLIWDDLVALRPTIGLAREPVAETPPSQVAPVQANPARSPNHRRKPPRRSKEHGAAIARFTLHLLDMPTAELDTMLYREAGDLLIKAYQAVGEREPPHHDTAASDAAKVRKAILARRAEGKACVSG